MSQVLENSIFSTLADMLSGSQVNSAAISKALELICKESSFECGLLYEVDLSNQYCLMEHFCSCQIPLDTSFFTQEFTQEEQRELADKEFFCLQQGKHTSSFERKLLDLFHAETLILTPVADENQNIYGLIVLTCSTCKVSLSQELSTSLFAMMSMLLHYVSIRMHKKRIKQSRLTLENILDNTGIDIYVNDFYNHDILYVNKSMAEPYGGQKMFRGQKCWRVLFPQQSGPCEFCPQKELIDEDGNPTKVYVWDYQRNFDGSWFRVFSSAFYWIDGRLAHVVSSADITDNKRNEAIIENLANYDQLTKLPNRRMLVKECEHRINNSPETENGYLLFFDIDGFKSINDNFGHDAGDEFLVQLGKFFNDIPLLHEYIYRNGGDEFVAIIGGPTIEKSHIESLASFIHQRFQKPWKLKKGDVYCNTSIGVACYPEDGVTAEELLQKADMAMYQVKKSGGGGLCFGYQLNRQ